MEDYTLMSKKRVTIEFYNQESEQQYTGRCVGLLSDKEFNAVVNKPDLQRKLMTVRTIPLVDVASVEEIQNLRLAAVINGKSNKETVGRKKLFITEPIEMISQFINPDDLSLIGTEGSFITITEKIEGI